MIINRHPFFYQACKRADIPRHNKWLCMDVVRNFGFRVRDLQPNEPPVQGGACQGRNDPAGGSISRQGES